MEMVSEYPEIATLPSVAAVNLLRGRFVKADGALCGSGELAAGVVHENVDAGDLVPVVYNGIAMVESGAAVAAGVEIMSDATGRAVLATALTVTVSVPSGATAVTSSAAQPDLTEAIAGASLTTKILGKTFTASTGAGQFVAVKLY